MQGGALLPLGSRDLLESVTFIDFGEGKRRLRQWRFFTPVMLIRNYYAGSGKNASRGGSRPAVALQDGLAEAGPAETGAGGGEKINDPSRDRKRAA